MHLPLSSTPPNTALTLGEPGEKEYRRLMRVLEMAQGCFTLLPVESDLTPRLRDVLLERLRADMLPKGLRLRVICLSRTEWDVFALPEMESPITPEEAVVLVGLGETPGMIQEAGKPSQRPPALALLNQYRETLRATIPAPFLVWCVPFAYTALLEHAPDFFDHYTGLFRFMDPLPTPIPARLLEALPLEITSSRTRRTPRTASRSSLSFYEREVASHQAQTPQRARALLGLAEALNALEESGESSARFREAELRTFSKNGGSAWEAPKEAKALVEEALGLLSPERDSHVWARGQSLLGNILAHQIHEGRKPDLNEARRCYEAALTVYTEQEHPYEWAMTQYNLAQILPELPQGDQEAHLRQAALGYEAALRVYEVQEYPYEWAMTQYNLGQTYFELQKHSEAIVCYGQALTFLTEADFPYEWALVQHALGNAYFSQHTEAPEQRLAQAQNSYEAALQVFTQAKYPYEYSRTHATLGLVKEQLQTVLQEQKAVVQPTPLRYQVALSFANEDRAYAKALADILLQKGISVFYEESQATEKRTEYLAEMVANRSELDSKNIRNVIVFFSQHSANVWNNSSSLSRLLEEYPSSFLPIWLDDPEISGLPSHLPALSCPPETLATIAELLLLRLQEEDRRSEIRPPTPNSGGDTLPSTDQFPQSWGLGGDTRIFIPAGEFLMGISEKDIEALLREYPNWQRSYNTEQLKRTIYLDSYSISKTPVTVAQYRLFCAITWRNMPPTPPWGWKDDHPIVNVSWEDAKAYCAWEGGNLPTEAEWEKAARGTDGRIYPWGNEWDGSKCANSVSPNDLKSTMPVGSYQEGTSPYGVLDMAGNVWEWCLDVYSANYYKAAPDRNPVNTQKGSFYTLRGGSFFNNEKIWFRASARNDFYRFVIGWGFRCVWHEDSP